MKHFLLLMVIFTGSFYLGIRYHKDNLMSESAVVVVPPRYTVPEYLTTSMNLVSAKGTVAEREYVANTILRVLRETFNYDRDMAENYITLLALESKFDHKAKSHAQAIGIGQVIPKYASEFGRHCGLIFESQDMDTPELNVTAGACQFKYLVEKHGNTSLALVAYNAGTYSKSVKSMKVMGGVSNLETANYVTKHTYVKELTTQGETK
jgi:hypothetical protein